MSKHAKKPRPRLSRREQARRRALAAARRGGRRRAAKLSPAARSEIARLGYQAMLRRRCQQILEAALFGVVE